MENIHVLLTDKPSKLYQKDGNFKLDTSAAIDWFISSAGYKPQNMYITSDEEIKEGDWYINTFVIEREQKPQTHTEKRHLINHQKDYRFKYCKKIILTTDPDLIADGVEYIDDDFLQWFVKNPSCEFVKTSWNPLNNEYDFIIPKEEAKMTAEDFFRKKLKELNPIQTVITLSRELITAEQGMRWAKEYSDYINK